MDIRFDNGPDYVSSSLMTWAGKKGIALTYIQSGKHHPNAYVEGYNRTVRHEPNSIVRGGSLLGENRLRSG
jgi:putative transposase